MGELTQPVEKGTKRWYVIQMDRVLYGGGSATMMGMKTRSFAPWVNVSLEELVPKEHFYRRLEQRLDLSFVRDFTQETYARGGRPSIDPIVFFKLQLVMFFEGIRSERQLMSHAEDRLSVRWYLGYDLDEPLPDHSSLTRIGTRSGVDIFRRFFEAIVERCQQAGLVWGKELYIDATKVNANASLESMKPRFAVEQHLADLFAPVPSEQGTEPLTVPSQTPQKPPEPLPTALTEARRAALSEENSQRHDWIARVGHPDTEEIRGNYQRISHFRVSTTDPDATMMQTRGGSHLGYHTQDACGWRKGENYSRRACHSF